MSKSRFLVFAFIILGFLAGFAGTAKAEIIFGITANTPDETDPTYAVANLVRFDSATPGSIITVGPITGVVAGHILRSLDIRPATSQIYGISTGSGLAGQPARSAAQIYIINPNTGACTPVGPGFVLGDGAAGNLDNNDPRVEMDFNPVADRIRVTTGANVTGANDDPVDNNFRVNPITGLLVTPLDIPFAYVQGDPNGGAIDPTMVAAAYTPPVGGVTTLYTWDAADDTLARIGSAGGSPDSPNTGKSFTVNTPSPRLTLTSAIGMDISFNTGTLFVTKDNNSPISFRMGLYTRTYNEPGGGATTLVGLYPANTFVMDITVVRTLTAAEVEVSGSVRAGVNSRGLVNALVTLTDPQGNIRTTYTGQAGVYRFENVPSGQVYVIRVQSNRFSFEPRVIDLNDSVSDVDFYPENTDRQPRTTKN